MVAKIPPALPRITPQVSNDVPAPKTDGVKPATAPNLEATYRAAETAKPPGAETARSTAVLGTRPGTLGQTREPLTGAEKLQLARIKELAGDTKTSFLVVSDVGRDHDDEVALLQLAALTRLGVADVLGVVTNYGTPDVVAHRADLAAGLLDQLGLGNVPVAAGSNAGKPVAAQSYEFQAPYANGARSQLGGLELMKQQLERAPDKSVSLMLLAGMTDAAELAEKYPDLLKQKLRDATVMGGVTEANGKLAPDQSFNNTVDMPAATSLFNKLQELGVPMTFLTRHAAGAAQIDMGFYNDLAATGGAAGTRLQKYQHHALQHLFDRASMPPGDPKREGLPDRVDRTWFLKTFTTAPEGFSGTDFWPYLKGLNPYDPLAVLAAIPGLSDALFSSKPLGTTGARIIGASPEDPGIKGNGEAQLSLRAMGKMALLLEHEDTGPHVKARTEAPKDYPARAPVSDAQVDWSVQAPDYGPAAYTADVVVKNDETKNPQGWADPATIAETKARRELHSLEGPVQWGRTTTYKENAETVELPLNPKGRTGLEGRGKLGRFGANPAGDAIVTRISPKTGKLEMLAIHRPPKGELAFPGGMVDKGEQPFQTIARELKEELDVSVDFHRATTVYGGYVDDPRNTDNAWMETTAMHVHLSPEQAKQIEPHATEEAPKWEWMPLDSKHLNGMYASHADIARRMLETTGLTG
jgi:ADP-ribose pyrophosphatase